MELIQLRSILRCSAAHALSQQTKGHPRECISGPASIGTLINLHGCPATPSTPNPLPGREAGAEDYHTGSFSTAGE